MKWHLYNPLKKGYFFVFFEYYGETKDAFCFILIEYIAFVNHFVGCDNKFDESA
jgi:hypothetical protein